MMEQAQSSNPQSAPHSAAAQHAAEAHSPQHASNVVGLGESADHALQSVGTLYNALDAVVSKSVRESPYVALAAAAGVGFILGGGIRSPFGQVLTRLGVKAFGPPLVTAALAAVAERAQGLTQQQP